MHLRTLTAPQRRQLKTLCDRMGRGGKMHKKTEGELFEVERTRDVPMSSEHFKIGATCALGALYEGEFGTPPLRLHDHAAEVEDGYGLDTSAVEVNGGDAEMYTRLERRFKVLGALVEGDDLPAATNAVGGMNLKEMIIAMNDEGRMTRGAIIRWMRRFV